MPKWELLIAIGTIGALSLHVERLAGLHAFAVPPPDVLGLAIVRNGDSIRVSWPQSFTGLVLQSTSDLAVPAWRAVEETTITNGGRWEIESLASNSNRFFRLNAASSSTRPPITLSNTVSRVGS